MFFWLPPKRIINNYCSFLSKPFEKQIMFFFLDKKELKNQDSRNVILALSPRPFIPPCLHNSLLRLQELKVGRLKILVTASPKDVAVSVLKQILRLFTCYLLFIEVFMSPSGLLRFTRNDEKC